MSIVTYATVTAAVYAVLLRPIPPVGYVGPQWPNEVIHVIVPIFIGLDWLLAPGRPALAWKSMLVAISYPVAWLAFTLLRGILTGWVPYPFLEPDGPGVWGGVLQYVLGIAAFIIAVAAVAITISRASQRRGVKSERPPFL